MSENTKFFGLWTVVRDSESARAAMRSSQITAFYLTFSYLVNVVFLLWMGQTPFSSVPADNIEKYFELGLYSTAVVLSFWMGLRIRKGKYGAVPIICAWIFIEIIAKTLLFPGKGVVLSIIFSVFAISALRGWFLRRKYGITEDGGKSNWFVVGAATIFGVPILFVAIFGLLSSVGVVPMTGVVSGGKMPNHQIQTLINNGILKNNEIIELFYSEGILSVAAGGQFLTSTKLVSYQKVDGKLEIYEMPYSAIASVELISRGHFFEDSVYRVNGNSYSNWESIHIILSIENNGDSRFIEKLEQNIANY